MPEARLVHPQRPTLEFRGPQQSELSREAQANITSQLATERKALVHTETRDLRYTPRGTVTGNRRAAADPNTSDPQQALANYAVELEAHVDEFQGAGGDTGYDYESDQLDTTKDAVLERVEWSLSPGALYELNYEADVVVGRGTMESRALKQDTVSVGAAFDTMLRLDGTPLPGFRDYRVSTSIGVEVRPVYDRSTAENNDVLIQDGTQRNVVFEGVHSGTRQERANADAALDALVATKNNVTLETWFPGYNIDGYVTAYNSTFEQQQTVGDGQNGAHRYRVEFVEGQRA